MTQTQLLDRQRQIEKRASDSVLRRPFKKHRYVNLDLPIPEKNRHLADGVAITRVYPRKRLGCSNYRKTEVVVSPEEDMMKRYGETIEEVDELGLRPIPAAIRDAFKRKKIADDITEKPWLCYQPNAKDTLPPYAYNLALKRQERGERPQFVPETSRSSLKGLSSRQYPTPRPHDQQDWESQGSSVDVLPKLDVPRQRFF